MQKTLDIEKYLEEAVRWVREHQERFWAIFGTTILSILFIALLVHHRQTENEEAWMQLGAIQSQLAQGKWGETGKALDTWESRFRGTNATGSSGPFG